MPFGQPGHGEFGTYFIGYSRSPRTIEQMLENMFIGRPPGNYDRLLDFSRAVTGTLFFVPATSFLQGVAADATPDATPAPRTAGMGADQSAPPAAPVRDRFAWHRHPQRKPPTMNNLHRELAPISDAAWAQIEEETTRTLKRYLAARRVVDLQAPEGVALSAVGTGHLRPIAAPDDGIIARQREVKALVELRVPFELDRQQIDDVERGANDSDWQPAKDAATEDRLRRGPRDLRWLCRGRHHRHPPGHQQSGHDAAGRRARISRRHRAGAEPVAAGRRQRSLFGGAGRRPLHRARRGERQRIPGAGSISSASSKPRSSGPRRSTALSC